MNSPGCLVALIFALPLPPLPAPCVG